MPKKLNLTPEEMVLHKAKLKRAWLTKKMGEDPIFAERRRQYIRNYLRAKRKVGTPERAEHAAQSREYYRTKAADPAWREARKERKREWYKTKAQDPMYKAYRALYAKHYRFQKKAEAHDQSKAA